MTIDTSGVFAKEINVGMTIKGSEGATVARGKGYRERVGMEDGASVAAWEVFARR